MSPILSIVGVMRDVRKLSVKSEYLDKTIEYYLKKVKVGRIENLTVKFAYTEPCGDTM